MIQNPHYLFHSSNMSDFILLLYLFPVIFLRYLNRNFSCCINCSISFKTGELCVLVVTTLRNVTLCLSLNFSIVYDF